MLSTRAMFTSVLLHLGLVRVACFVEREGRGKREADLVPFLGPSFARPLKLLRRLAGLGQREVALLMRMPLR